MPRVSVSSVQTVVSDDEAIMLMLQLAIGEVQERMCHPYHKVLGTREDLCDLTTFMKVVEQNICPPAPVKRTVEDYKPWTGKRSTEFSPWLGKRSNPVAPEWWKRNGGGGGGYQWNRLKKASDFQWNRLRRANFDPETTNLKKPNKIYQWNTL